MKYRLPWSSRENGSCLARAGLWSVFPGSVPFFLLLAFAIPVIGQTSALEGLPPVLRQVDFQPQLHAAVPLDAVFRDETGREIRLGDYFSGKPVVLALVYYTCPMLCDEVLEGVASNLRIVSLSPGKDYQVVAVSFNPDESAKVALDKKEELLKQFPKAGAAAGWHFLTGEQSSIAALTGSVNFRYAYDPETKTYAHASGILILTPQGKISRYFYGIDYPARDLQFALIDASAGKIGAAADHLLLFCYQYDPKTGKYGVAVVRLLRWGGILFIAGLLALVLLFLRHDKHRHTRHASARSQES
jgi:protein SCO1